MLGSPAGVGGEKAAHGRIATLHGGAGWVAWEPHVPYEQLVLTVSAPDGTVSREEFSAGSRPIFDGPLADGQYTYELRVVPVVDPEVRAALQAARDTGRGAHVARLRMQAEVPRGPQVQSGYFSIRGGALVPPTVAEER
jgi:hypothetical protein